MLLTNISPLYIVVILYTQKLNNFFAYDTQLSFSKKNYLACFLQANIGRKKVNSIVQRYNVVVNKYDGIPSSSCILKSAFSKS